MRRQKLPAPPQLRDRDWLVREYVLNQRSTTDIGEHLGRNHSLVHRWLQRHGIPLRR